MKEKNKLDSIKIKNVCSLKGALNRMKGQAIDGEIFAGDIANKGLIYKKYT